MQRLVSGARAVEPGARGRLAGAAGGHQRERERLAVGGVEQQRLEAFFRVYKELPEGRKKVELAGFNDAAAAKQEIKSAWEAWKAKNPQ